MTNAIIVDNSANTAIQTKSSETLKKAAKISLMRLFLLKNIPISDEVLNAWVKMAADDKLFIEDFAKACTDLAHSSDVRKPQYSDIFLIASKLRTERQREKTKQEERKELFNLAKESGKNIS